MSTCNGLPWVFEGIKKGIVMTRDTDNPDERKLIEVQTLGFMKEFLPLCSRTWIAQSLARSIRTGT